MRHRQLSLLSPIPVPQFHSSLMLYMRVSALLVTAERTPRSSIRFVATLSSLITSVCVVQFGDISRVRYIQQMTKEVFSCACARVLCSTLVGLTARRSTDNDIAPVPIGVVDLT